MWAVFINELPYFALRAQAAAVLLYAPKPVQYPDALTPQQVREMLGVGQRMTYALLRGGTIPSVRMGRLYRVPKVAVIDYLCSTAENT